MRLVRDWRAGWRYYSTWAFALLLAAPDLYQLLIVWHGWDQIPPQAAWLIRSIALVGLVARFVAQHRPEPGPTEE